MGFLGNILSANPVGKIISSVVDNITTSSAEKEAAKVELEKVLLQRDAEVEKTMRAELGAKERIMVAELQSGDKFTMRARPTLAYSGLFLIFWSYGVAPAMSLGRMDLPEFFWMSWGGVVATWSVGRSFEKIGKKSKATSVITGSKILED
jgi:hypothetical protein